MIICEFYYSPEELSKIANFLVLGSGVGSEEYYISDLTKCIVKMLNVLNENDNHSPTPTIEQYRNGNCSIFICYFRLNFAAGWTVKFITPFTDSRHYETVSFDFTTLCKDLVHKQIKEQPIKDIIE